MCCKAKAMAQMDSQPSFEFQTLSFWGSVLTSLKIACNYVEKRKLQSYVLIEESIRNWDADLLKDLVE